MNWYRLKQSYEVKIDSAASAGALAGTHRILADEWEDGFALRSPQNLYRLKEPVSFDDMKQYADVVYPLGDIERLRAGTPPALCTYIIESTELVFMESEAKAMGWFE